MENNRPYQKNGCNAAYPIDEFHGWGCDISGSHCMFIYPNAKACAEKYDEGPLSSDALGVEEEDHGT